MGFEILGMVLIIVAFVFIGIECVVPGFGVPGIVGIGCFVVGVALSASTIGEAIKLIAILLVLLAIFVFIVLTLLLMFSIPLEKSTSFHVRERTSPRLRPIPTARSISR